MKTKGIRKRLIILLIVIILLFTVIPFILGVVIYNANFGGRIETAEALHYDISEFPGLEREQIDIRSDNDVKLGAWLYSNNTLDKPKALIVTLHGMGIGGHNTEMNVIDHFAKNGYIVLAFDASGTDDSEGKAGGFPQEFSDAHHVLEYVRNTPELSEYPLFLWGRSMGAYSGSALLKLHPEIKGLISVSGFNNVTDPLRYNGVPFFVPYVHLYERLKWGSNADITAMDGFAASDARIMIIQGSDDTMAPPEAGWDIYYEKYANDQRFEFVWVEGKGHMDVYGTDELTKYLKSVNINTIDQNTLDKSKFKELDPDMMNKMTSFFDSCLYANSP